MPGISAPGKAPRETLRLVLALASSMTLATLFPMSGAQAEIAHRWSDAAKESVGTAQGRFSSNIWFTVGRGIINEVYYPSVDRAQVGDSQLLFGVSKEFFAEEKRDFAFSIIHPEGVPRPILRGVHESARGRIEFIKEIVTDPELAVLRIRYQIVALPTGTRVYVLHKPAADNDGAHDYGRVIKFGPYTGLVAWDDKSQKPSVQAVISTAPVARASVGVVGETDGWQDLKTYGQMVNEIQANGPSNIAYMAELQPQSSFEVAIGFGSYGEQALTRAAASLRASFQTVTQAYDAGWRRYTAQLARAPWLQGLPPETQSELLWNAVVIKTHEDKLQPGAIVASLSIPSLPSGGGHKDGKDTGGYHLVWPRDLFKSALALLRLGDVETALNAFRFMMRMEHNGRMNQNSWTDGRPSWNATQMDQESFPLLLGRELTRYGVEHDAEANAFMARRAAKIRQSRGRTEQERWEELGSYSPNSIAVMAGALASVGDQNGAAQLLSTALSTTVTTVGPYADVPYFIRLTQNGDPNAGDPIQIPNRGPWLREYEVIDGGFLEWLRWFPRPESYFGELGTTLARVISNTLPVYDNPASGVASFVNGLPLYKRYTGDSYGLRHRGGPWPILTAERALPELASNPSAALKYYSYVRRMWGPGELCPEQLGPDLRPMRFASTPLVWCHAEMIELLYRGKLQSVSGGRR